MMILGGGLGLVVVVAKTRGKDGMIICQTGGAISLGERWGLSEPRTSVQYK